MAAGGSSRRLARGLALALLALHLMLPLLAAVAHAASPGAGADSLKRLGYLFATILVFIGGIAYALGRSDIAKSSWAWAIVVAAATAWALSHAGGLGGAGLEARLVCPPRSVYTDLPVYVVVTGPPGRYTVSWDDGSTSGCEIASGGYYCAVSHVYAAPGNYTITAVGAEGSCSVSAVSLSGTLERALREAVPESCGGNVFSKEFWACMGEKFIVGAFGKIYGALLGFTTKVVGQGGGALDRLVMGLITVPEGIRVYSAAHQAALQWLGWAVVIAAVWRAFWEFERGLSWLDALREIAFAGLALALVPDLYTAAAKAVNSVAIAVGQPGQALSLLVSLLTMAVLWAVLPLPGAGGFAGMVAAGAGMLGLVALLKYLTVWGIMSVYPLLVLLWLIPFTRSVARTMAMTVIGIMAWSLVLAGMTGALATVLADPMGMSPLEAVVVSLATPAVMLLSGVGVLGGVFNLPVPGAGIAQRLIGGIATRIGIAAQQPQAALTAAPGAVIGHTEYLRPPMTVMPAPGGAWQPPVWHGTGMAITVPPHTAASHTRTEWLRPGAGAGPTPEQVRAAQRLYEASAGRQLSETWSPPPGRVAEAAKAIQAMKQRQPPKIEELPTGRKWEAIRTTGAALGRLEAYFENRARQFVREFAVAFEARTGIRVPDRLKTITQLDRLDIETRKYMGAKAVEYVARTIYIRIARPDKMQQKMTMLQTNKTALRAAKPPSQGP